jgi:hypothetical protein
MSKLEDLPPVICITTNRSKDRLKNFINQCNLYNISNYSIYCFKSYSECNYIIYGQYIDKIQENSKGPVTSHIKALNIWYTNSDDEYVLVFEDDVDLTTINYWNFTWKNFFDFLPKDWECIQLCSIRESFNDIPISFRSRLNSDWGCQAYLVKRSYVKKILDKYYIDKNTFKLEISNAHIKINLYESGIYDLYPIVENVLFEGIGDVYNFPLFVEDIKNTNSNFIDYHSMPIDEPHMYSYYYIMNWWKNNGKYFKLRNEI